MTEFAVAAEDREAVAAWIAEHLAPVEASLNRYLLQRGVIRIADETLAVAFRLTFPDRTGVVPATFGATTPRLRLYSRNSVSWIAARSWTLASKAADLQSLKSAKLACPAGVIDLAAEEVSDALRRALGSPRGACVTTVPCGHSRRDDCFALQVAQAVAVKLSLEFRQVFDHRFVAGSSHPKEFRKLPPLIVRERPPEPTVIVVDDVATSGWHMEEALTRLRGEGFGAFGAVWLGGNVEG